MRPPVFCGRNMPWMRSAVGWSWMSAVRYATRSRCEGRSTGCRLSKAKYLPTLASVSGWFVDLSDGA